MTALMPEVAETRYHDAPALAVGLADRVAAKLEHAITARGAAGLVVSGGRSPVAFFERLSERRLDWGAVTVSLADERWVPPDSPDSNEALVRRHLLKGRAAGAGFIGLYGGEATPEEGEAACATRLTALPRRLDVVVLGLGLDGHTASLFPGAADLEAALRDGGRPCRAIRAPGAAQPRMTLTLPRLLQTRLLILTFQGEDKHRVYETAFGEGPVEALPVRALLRQAEAPLEVHWSP